jgi:hypothetical protein
LAAESWTFEELVSAGWTEADLEWEKASESALQDIANDDLDQAREKFAKGLRIANESFAPDDPRLGTSLANQAAGITAAGRPELAARTLADAVQVWRNCEGWVAKMTAPRVARSSLFHLRMEQRHRPAYEARWRIKWSELVGEARASIGDGAGMSLISSTEAADQVARWLRERPAMLNDTRKLMAAVILLACRRP